MKVVTIVEKILRSLTPMFDYVVCTIEESKDIDALSLNELQSYLLIHEKNVNRNSNSAAKEQVLGASTNTRSTCRGRGRGRGRVQGRGRGNYRENQQQQEKEWGRWSHHTTLNVINATGMGITSHNAGPSCPRTMGKNLILLKKKKCVF